jgi:hypothetical protein
MPPELLGYPVAMGIDMQRHGLEVAVAALEAAALA